MTQFDRDKLVTDNLRLVYYLYEKLTKNPLTENYKDDIISEGMVGLVKAANTFDDGRGIKFGTYASRCITNEMLMFIRRMNKQLPHEVSLYVPIDKNANGHVLCYADILSNEDSIPESCIYAAAVDSFMAKQSETDREIMDALRQGYKQKEIAEIVGIRQPTVSRRIRKLRLKFRKEFSEK